MLITGISESCAGVSGTKCAVHLDLARSNVVEFLLAPGRSCRCAPVERAAPPRAQPIKLCAPVRFRSAIGCHRTLHALEANKWQCAGNHGTWRLDRSDCGHRTFMSELPHHERCRIQVRSAREARPVERGGGGDDGRARMIKSSLFVKTARGDLCTPLLCAVTAVGGVYESQGTLPGAAPFPPGMVVQH